MNAPFELINTTNGWSKSQNKRNRQFVLCPVHVIVCEFKHNQMKQVLKCNPEKATHLSVNLWKLYKANNSKDKQLVPATFRVSSVRLIHCSFRTFKCGHPLITASTPLLWMNSESNDKVSRDLHCDPTTSIETSVILAQAATPRDFNAFPTHQSLSQFPIHNHYLNLFLANKISKESLKKAKFY